MMFVLDNGSMNDMELATLRRFMELVKHGAKFIDIRVRKDAQEYSFQADFLKHIKEG